ncbi:polysaccharide pyruvyl transferase family protein [Sphingobacterium kitahiroshimense]|uniref:Polysaccharide pyruvyl transferase family protein n=1 Tax=Sphingobacterium kitahiroshimense TaxID=470446 RepID=A0ABV0BY81_9SPHI
MKQINLIYWGGQNFGDALSPMLIEELSGIKVQPKSWDNSVFARYKRLFGNICKLRLSELNNILWPSEPSLIAVGSVICWGNKRSQIWGSGFMNNHESFGGGTVHAVRGKLTSQKLVEMGQPRCEIFGDPALLLPLWIPAQKEKKHKLGVIPHWKEADMFKELVDDRCKFIDLRTTDVERIVKEICDCEYILSSSLHGLIVAHAYGIPALWVKREHIGTDGFKFCDYFSSVDIPFYDGFEELEEIFANEKAWMSLFETHWDKANSHVDISKLQDKLLEAFPFPLRSRYQKFIKN